MADIRNPVTTSLRGQSMTLPDTVVEGSTVADVSVLTINHDTVEMERITPG